LEVGQELCSQQTLEGGDWNSIWIGVGGSSTSSGREEVVGYQREFASGARRCRIRKGDRELISLGNFWGRTRAISCSCSVDGHLMPLRSLLLSFSLWVPSGIGPTWVPQRVPCRARPFRCLFSFRCFTSPHPSETEKSACCVFFSQDFVSGSADSLQPAAVQSIQSITLTRQRAFLPMSRSGRCCNGIKFGADWPPSGAVRTVLDCGRVAIPRPCRYTQVYARKTLYARLGSARNAETRTGLRLGASPARGEGPELRGRPPSATEILAALLPPSSDSSADHKPVSVMPLRPFPHPDPRN
jgi:hypothetical protein